MWSEKHQRVLRLRVPQDPVEAPRKASRRGEHLRQGEKARASPRFPVGPPRQDCEGGGSTGGVRGGQERGSTRGVRGDQKTKKKGVNLNRTDTIFEKDDREITRAENLPVCPELYRSLWLVIGP